MVFGKLQRHGDSSLEIDKFVHRLYTEFSLKDMGSLYYFLGVVVTRLFTSDLYLCQRKYILDLLDRVIWPRLKDSIHT
ncbi:hypothetical protein EPI10_028831 [Gossypium australe]|uniref:Retrovirus-related Pol polyprotein from transposon TNT 1-94 n=1 Tax=Gossypium australe TaxID=47621 RepID=A0A5B6UY03_9ROSI|nr:hypothetical protein EPI10_028831 [Gossypium australe]